MYINYPRCTKNYNHCYYSGVSNYLITLGTTTSEGAISQFGSGQRRRRTVRSYAEQLREIAVVAINLRGQMHYGSGLSNWSVPKNDTTENQEKEQQVGVRNVQEFQQHKHVVQTAFWACGSSKLHDLWSVFLFYCTQIVLLLGVD